MTGWRAGALLHPGTRHHSRPRRLRTLPQVVLRLGPPGGDFHLRLHTRDERQEVGPDHGGIRKEQEGQDYYGFKHRNCTRSGGGREEHIVILNEFHNNSLTCGNIAKLNFSQIIHVLNLVKNYLHIYIRKALMIDLLCAQKYLFTHLAFLIISLDFI